MKFEKMIPKHRGRGKILPIDLYREIEEVEYQPAHGIFFIPEHLGFHVGDYVDFYEWHPDDIDKKFFCIVTLGCPLNGRRISPYEKSKPQKIARKKRRAKVCLSLPDFNEWYLELPFPKQVDPQENHGRMFQAKSFLFMDTFDGEFTTKNRIGIVLNLEEPRLLNGKTNPAAIPPSAQLPNNVQTLIEY